MASGGISTLILFIAAILVAAGVAGTLVTNVNQISNSIESHSAGVTEKIDTDVEIISDAGSDAIYDGTNETVTVLVKNTGSNTLSDEARHLDVLLDGEYVSDDDKSLEVITASSWRPGAVAELTIDRQLAAGEHRVVIVANSEREVFEFYVS